MTRSLCASLVMLGLFLTGPDNSAPAGGDKEKGTTVTDKDNNKKVSIAKGDQLTVKLPMTAGTGFTWQISINEPTQLLPQGKPEVVRGDPNKKVVGGAQTIVFRFKAESTGVSILQLNYRRPFEKDKAPAKTFKISVEIK